MSDEEPMTRPEIVAADHCNSKLPPGGFEAFQFHKCTSLPCRVVGVFGTTIAGEANEASCLYIPQAARLRVHRIDDMKEFNLRPYFMNEKGTSTLKNICYLSSGSDALRVIVPFFSPLFSTVITTSLGFTLI